MEILLRNAGFINKGAEAMLRTAQREIGRRLPGSNFLLFSAGAETQFANASGLSAIFSESSIRKKILRSIPLFSFAQDFCLKQSNSDFAQAVRHSRFAAYEIYKIRSIDAIIDISGYAYGDTWGPMNCLDTLAWLDYCITHKKPYLFLPQAWGPFDNEEVASLSQKFCQNAAMLFSRDHESSGYLSKLCNQPLDSFVPVSDIVFRFQGAPKNAGTAVLNNLGCEVGSGALIGLVPNMRVYERTSGTGAKNEYVQLLVKVANFCINKLKAKVLLSPNEIALPGSTKIDDRFLCALIQTLVEQNDHCFALRDCYPSEIIKSVISNLDLLIASRFHSLVFALSSGVPVLALGWSHKYLELLRAFGLSEYVFRHDHLDKETFMALLEKAWNERENNQKKINNVLPSIQGEVDDLFDLVAKIIQESQR